jgi:hypothetical protein
MEEERYKFHWNLFQQGASTDDTLVDRQSMQFPNAFSLHSSTVNELNKSFSKGEGKERKCTVSEMTVLI